MKEKLDVMLGFIKNLKSKYNLQVQYLCCNNAGENVAFERACKQEGMGVDFEYTALSDNKMATSNENLLPFSTRYMPCLMAVNLMLTFKMAYGPKLQTPPSFSKATF